MSEPIKLVAFCGSLRKGSLNRMALNAFIERLPAGAKVETIEIGEKGGLPTQVTHHKIIGKANWGRSVETLRMIDEAGARALANAATDTIPLVPFPSPEVQYLDAHEEENFRIAQASTPTEIRRASCRERV